MLLRSVVLCILGVAVACASVNEWTLQGDEEGNLVAASTSSSTSRSHVEVPALRVAHGPHHLDIRYSDTHFALSASPGTEIRIGNVSVAALQQQVALLTAENAKLQAESAATRLRQGRLQCGLVASGMEGLADAIKMATIGARAWTHFAVDGSHYLVVANERNISAAAIAFQQDSVVYKWTSGAFVVHQSIPTRGAFDWEYFMIGDEHFLAVANYFAAGLHSQDSDIFVWSRGAFVHNQSIPTIGAVDWEHFVIGDEHYLAVANLQNTSSSLQDSVIYHFNPSAGKFLASQNIATMGAYDWEHFVIGGEHFLAVANHFVGKSHSQESAVYKWSGEAALGFEVHQSIPTLGASDWEHFTIGDEHFLAVANLIFDSSYSQMSAIYKWARTQDAFVHFQNISTYGAHDWEHFAIGDDHFLAVANYRNADAYAQDSVVYRWNSYCFV